MKTAFARALLSLAILAGVALPASAFAASKTPHSRGVAKKELKKKSGGKHHSGHKTASSKTHAAIPAKPS